MDGVRLRFGVTCCAGENRVVRWIHVTVAARFGVAVTRIPPGVIECRSRPGCRAVARSARGRESGSRMAGIRCGFVFG